MTAATSLLLSIAALVVSISTTVYNQRVTGRREIDKWRRDELLRTTAELAQLASDRQALLSAAFDGEVETGPRVDIHNSTTRGGPDPIRSVDTMFVLVERIRLIDTAVADAAEKLAQAHRAALRDGDQVHPTDIAGYVDAISVHVEEHARLHRQLINAFRVATGQPEIS